MPEYLFVFAASGLVALISIATRKFENSDQRLDQLELKVAEKYITKHDFKNHQTILYQTLTRLEDKIDAHMSEDQTKINHIKRKYDL